MSVGSSVPRYLAIDRMVSFVVEAPKATITVNKSNHGSKAMPGSSRKTGSRSLAASHWKEPYDAHVCNYTGDDINEFYYIPHYRHGKGVMINRFISYPIFHPFVHQSKHIQLPIQ